MNNFQCPDCGEIACICLDPGITRLKAEVEQLSNRVGSIGRALENEIEERLKVGERLVKASDANRRHMAKIESLTADNAVMLDVLKGVWDRPKDSENYRRTWQIMGRDHPGQALLDRQAKLEADNASSLKFIRDEADTLDKYAVTARAQEYRLFAAQSHPGQALLDEIKYLREFFEVNQKFHDEDLRKIAKLETVAEVALHLKMAWDGAMGDIKPWNVDCLEDEVEKLDEALAALEEWLEETK